MKAGLHAEGRDRSRGGKCDRALVAIALPAGITSAALDGVDFVVGDQYLVTATDGFVNGCGFSGPATSEFETAFTSAFGG